MKFCNVTSVHPRYDIRIFHKECWAQSLRGEAHLVVADGKPDEIKNNIHIHGVKKYRNRFLRMILAVWAVYKKAKSIKADVYILHDPELLLIALSLKKTGAKVFFDSHECYFECIKDKFWISTLFRKCISRIYGYVESRIVSCLDGIIAATDHIGDVLRKYNENVYVLHNYVLLKEFSKCEKLDVENSAHILYCGGISKNRNILNMVKALELCRNGIKLILCGTFECASLLEECKQLSGWTKVEYMGQVDRQQLHDLAKKCFCGLVFFDNTDNNKNGIPNKIFEYAGMYLPVLCSNFDTWGKIIGNKGEPFGLSLNPENPQEIADAIDELYENKILAKHLGENGRKAVEKMYNFESEMEGYLK